MKNRIALAAALVFVAATAAGAGPAKPRTIELDRDAIVGTAVVPAGSYQLDFGVGRTTATFLQGKRVVAEVPVAVGLTQAIYAGTAVHYRATDAGHDRLLKIVFATDKIAVEFPAESTVAGEPKAPGTTEIR
jgi:hypothetical protein